MEQEPSTNEMTIQSKSTKEDSHLEESSRVFDFSSYRSFLVSYYERARARAKARGGSLSIRSISQRLKLKSPATLNMVLKGHRHPGPELVAKLCEYFQFTDLEREYFETLVYLAKNRGTETQRVELIRRMQMINPNKDVVLMDEESFALISKWYVFTIRELVARSDFQRDLSWIRKTLNNRVTLSQAKEALTILLSKGFVKEVNGKLVQTEPHVRSTSDVPSEALKQHHEQMLELAKDSIRKVDVQYRDIASSTFNIDIQDLPKIKKELNDFRMQLYKKYENNSGHHTYQIGLQLFPLSNLKNENFKRVAPSKKTASRKDVTQ